MTASAESTLGQKIRELLKVLEITLRQFNPQTTDEVTRFFPRPEDFGRTKMRDILDGDFLEGWLAGPLGDRLQMFLTTVIDDREKLERLKLERLRIVQKQDSNPPQRLTDEEVRTLLKDAIEEHSATASTMAQWESAAKEIEDRRLTRADRIAATLSLTDKIIKERSRKAGPNELAEKLADLCVGKGAILSCNKGKFSIADRETLLNNYGNLEGRRQNRQDDRNRSNDPIINTALVTFDVLPEYFCEERLRAFEEFVEQLRRMGIGVMLIKDAREGCTTIVVETTADGVHEMLDAFQQGKFAGLGIISITGALSKNEIASSIPALAHVIPVTLAEPEPFQMLEQQLRSAFRRESFVRPWRRLRYLFDPSIARSPLWHTIAASNDRAYASPHLAGRWKSLRADLFMTMIMWPLLSGAFMALGLLFLPWHSLEFGILTGLALALLGAQPCSLLISPLACGTGILAMASAFGFVHAIIFAHFNVAVLFSRSNILDNFFLSIDGGVVGLSAPVWHSSLGVPLIIGMISSMAISIAAAGWLMRQPQRAQERPSHRITTKEITGAFMGTMAGSGIGLVYGLDRLFHMWLIQPISFILAFALVGGPLIGFSTYLRFESTVRLRSRLIRRALLVGFSCAAMGGGLFGVAFSAAGSSLGVIALAASCGVFQSVFFTAAFVIAQRKGGSRAAFAATTLEGALGFTVFAIIRIAG